jgi:hypothetical protein
LFATFAGRFVNVADKRVRGATETPQFEVFGEKNG